MTHCFNCGIEDDTVKLSLCDGCTHSWYIMRGESCPLKNCTSCDELRLKHAI